MRKFLAFILAVGALAFLSSGADAFVKLTQQQVKNVCGSQTDGSGYSYCQKKCAGGNTCEFGCGPKGCGGGCLTCKSASQASINNTIRAGLTGKNLMSGRGSGGGSKITGKSSAGLLAPQGTLLSNQTIGGTPAGKVKGGTVHAITPATSGPLMRQ